ncbi:MAG: DUF4390 domain-containing protein [Gemmatimonadales bacterium]
MAGLSAARRLGGSALGIPGSALGIPGPALGARQLGAILGMAVLLGFQVPAAAQQEGVSLSVRLSPTVMPNGARPPWIQVRNLLADRTWAEHLDQAFPIRLQYRLEIWRSRSGWLDDFQRATEWSMVIQRELLQDVYKVTQIFRAEVREQRFPTRDELARFVGSIYQPEVLPRGTGTFYYNVSVAISALSDEDMKELERFLSGVEPNQQTPEPSSVAMWLRRLLLRIAGLPEQRLEARSETFVAR